MSGYGTVVDRDHCATTTLRRARKLHECSNCLGVILPGADYLLNKAFPGHDVIGGNRPRTMPQCRACAERYDRAHLLPSQKTDAPTRCTCHEDPPRGGAHWADCPNAKTDPQATR